MDTKQLGERIKEARNARGYTLDDLALAIGLNKSTISRYEKGLIVNPKIPVIEAIGNELQTNPAWLTGKSPDKSYTSPNSGFALYEPCSLFSPLKNLRKARRVSSEAVAYAIGISKADYLAIESGRNTDCMTLVKIANYYACSADFALSCDGTINEDQQISHLTATLLRLHEAFRQLSDEDQEAVIKFAHDKLESSDQ